MAELTKKEKRELAKEKKRKERMKEEIISKLKKFIGIGLVVALLGGGVYWLYREATKPLPGQQVEDIGREHVPDGTEVEYNSNPPTSGSHYTEWTRAGVYDRPFSDGHLVHSLEHGYVIMSYNCGVEDTGFLFKSVYAHEEELHSTESAEIKEVERPEGEVWGSEECKDLIENLTQIYQEKGERKLIVIPRSQLDTRIALTAWTRIDKFNEFDKERIVKFIDTYRDRGPEQTTE